MKYSNIFLMKNFITMLALLFLFIGFQPSFAESVAGKSIIFKGKYVYRTCRITGCKNSGAVNANHRIYVSKDGKKIFDYTGSKSGNLLISGITKDGVLAVAQGNSVIVRVPGNGNSTISYTVNGNNCRFAGRYQTKNGSTSKVKVLGPMRCKVQSGNAFK